MSARGALALLALLCLTVPAAGQPVSERRVRAAIDDAARGLGQAISGGSPLSAPSAATGGLGHFSIGASGTVTFMEIEDPTHEDGTVDFILPTGTLTAAIGIAGGGDLPGGAGGFGAVDILGKVGPVVAREEIEEGQPLYGLGARVGVLREGALFPSVSVTAYRSWVDDLGWGEPEADEVSFTGDVGAWSFRADVSKKLLLVTPYAGVGYDRTSIEADYRIPASASTGGEEVRGSIDVSSGHSKAYAGLELPLALLDVSVELGRYDGGTFAAVGLQLVN
ncbi:MAG: hypothetical protein KY397_01230 [Gemmatimonadetes bacterium]|nr:hypothetical protein [Gemmatimonadota bacterium]